MAKLIICSVLIKWLIIKNGIKGETLGQALDLENRPKGRGIDANLKLAQA